MKLSIDRASCGPHDFSDEKHVIGIKLSDMLPHHYSDNEIKEIFSKEQSIELKHYTRPRGLWASVVGDRDWPSLNPGDLRSQNQYKITLADDAKVLFIDGREQLSAFTKKYGLKPSGERRIAIDWVRVAAEHQGLVIAPYMAEHTKYPALFWYGAWGCASGCIWNKDAISEIKLVRVGEPFWWLKGNAPSLRDLIGPSKHQRKLLVSL